MHNKFTFTTNLSEYILIFGVILSPMTSLRIWKIGPGEILCLIYTLTKMKIIFRSHMLNHYLFRFWGFWLLLIIAGMFIGVVISPNQIDIIQLTTYLYLGVVCIGLFHGLQNQQDHIILNLIYKITFFSTVLYGALYLYGKFFAGSIFGFPLWFGGIRFSPIGENPHQFAGYAGGLVYFALFLIFQKYKTIKTFTCLIIVLYLSLQTFSSTLVAAYVLSLLLFPILLLRRTKYLYIYLLAILLLTVTMVLVMFDSLYDAIYNWIIFDPNGLGRFQIWGSLFKTFWKSPIIGLGPGSHALRFTGSSIAHGGYMEYHNSYLELFAMSGLLGLGNFLFFYQKILVRSYRESPPLFAMLIFLGGYAFGGFIFRRLSFWILATFAIVILEKYALAKEKV